MNRVRNVGRESDRNTCSTDSPLLKLPLYSWGLGLELWILEHGKVSLIKYANLKLPDYPTLKSPSLPVPDLQRA